MIGLKQIQLDDRSLRRMRNQMEKKFIPILLFMGIVSFSECMDQKQEALETNVSVMEEEKQEKKELQEIELYERNIQNFESISAKKGIEQTIAKPTFIYFGRKTCPFCREFVPILNNVKQRTGSKILYIDTEDTPTDDNLKKVRGMYDISLKKDNSYEKFDTEEYEKLEPWLLEHQNN